MSRVYEISEFIIEKVIENTTDCQYIVDFDEIESKFGELSMMDILLTSIIIEDDYRVADLEVHENWFDVVVFLEYVCGC